MLWLLHFAEACGSTQCLRSAEENPLYLTRSSMQTRTNVSHRALRFSLSRLVSEGYRRTFLSHNRMARSQLPAHQPAKPIRKPLHNDISFALSAIQMDTTVYNSNDPRLDPINRMFASFGSHAFASRYAIRLASPVGSDVRTSEATVSDQAFRRPLRYAYEFVE